MLHRSYFYHSFCKFFQGYAPSIVSQLCELSNSGVEELRVLQTILILITTSQVVEKDSLAKVGLSSFLNLTWFKATGFVSIQPNILFCKCTHFLHSFCCQPYVDLFFYYFCKWITQLGGLIRDFTRD